jgi:hypothetical protein
VAVVGGRGVGEAQIDTERRANLELGVEGPLRGNGPISGYIFFLWNRPHFLEEEDLYLRVVVAPVYLNAELVRDGWPAPGHALGIGGGGGLFAYNFDEFRDGRHLGEESFWGHGAEVIASYYRRFKIADVLPIEGQLRLRPQYNVYQRGPDTAREFRLPADTLIQSARVGLRLGGVPPELLPDVAVELSLWYEPSFRESTEPYGLPGALREPKHLTQKTWARAGGIVSLFGNHTARLFATVGTAPDTDALSSFRLGSALPFRSEFPLLLHGYYLDEVFAKRSWLMNFSYHFPFWPGTERYRLRLNADYARVEYLDRHELPRHGLRGVGADLTIALRDWITLILGYGYGFDAPRGSGFGGHEANALIEFKF